MSWNRRRLTGGIALAAALPLLPAAPDAAEALLAALGDRRAAARVGRLVLAAWPRLRGEDIVRSLGADRGRARLAARIRADFAAGRTLKLDGWIVSATEARLCALAALKA